jgi:hypothetical protein
MLANVNPNSHILSRLSELDNKPGELLAHMLTLYEAQPDNTNMVLLLEVCDRCEQMSCTAVVHQTSNVPEGMLWPVAVERATERHIHRIHLAHDAYEPDQLTLSRHAHDSSFGAKLEVSRTSNQIKHLRGRYCIEHDTCMEYS